MKPETKLCISSFFTCWGDRMWQFATGLYLVQLTPGSLRLAAIYGLILSITAIVFSPMIGDWIDRNSRLKVVRLLLFIQNTLVVICAIMIYSCMISERTGVRLLFQALIIIIGSSANLAGQGQKIAVGKDWIVVVCKGDKNLLADTNALIRRIDLTVAILAPLVVGFLMTVVSALAGIIFICVWNVVSLFVEYGLLIKVYRSTAALANKKENEKTFDLELEGMEDYKVNTGKEDDTEQLNKETVSVVDGEVDVEILDSKEVKNNWNLLHRLKVVLSGWKVYYRQEVFLAGCSLAMLYLTVIGFSTITLGYAFEQGLSELYVSICLGLGSLLGVFGTIIFPIIRERIGLVKTGIVGFSLQWAMLLLCGISLWLPGSPSNLYNGHTDEQLSNLYINTTTIAPLLKNGTTPVTVTPEKPEKILTSIIVLMSGIILSRTGLWLSDLTITQLQQEYVPEKERGVVGGVQYSSNCLLDVGQFVLTIILPKPEQFGILILISICAILLGGFIYMVFMSKFTPQETLEEEKSSQEELKTIEGE